MIPAFLELREIHQVFAAADEVLAKDVGVPLCLPKCGICCQQNVPHAMTIEGINAISVLTGQGRLRQMVSICEGWLLEHSSFATIYKGMPIGLASPQLRDEWYRTSRSQCPFLDRDMRCMVYEVRPLTCRAYGVTRDNSELCPRPLGRGESMTARRIIPAPLLRDKVDSFRGRCQQKNKVWVISGFFPTVIYRAAEEKKFARLVRDNLIAGAKIIGMDIDTTLMWQPQVDMLRAGVSPDLVVRRPDLVSVRGR
mgnify:CR=1 FL=1